MLKLLMPIVAIALTATAAPAFADDSMTLAQTKLRIDRSDLATVSGRRGIERKIDFVVNRVCGDQVLGIKEEVDMIRDCKTTARSMARAQLPMTVADNR